MSTGSTTDYMNDRMVADRCARYWRMKQYSRLRGFASREPRAVAWALLKMAAEMKLPADDPRVGAALDQRLEVEGGGGVPASQDFHVAEAITQEVLTSMVMAVVAEIDEEENAVPSPPPPPLAEDAPLPSRAIALFNQFAIEREHGDITEAGRLLLDCVEAGRGSVPPISALELRELAAQLSAAGQFRLLADLVIALPPKIVASTVVDLGEKLRAGALAQPLLAEVSSQLRARQSPDKKDLGTRFLELVRTWTT